MAGSAERPPVAEKEQEVELSARLIKESDGRVKLMISKKGPAQSLLEELTKKEEYQDHITNLLLVGVTDDSDEISFRVHRGSDVAGHPDEIFFLQNWVPENYYKRPDEDKDQNNG